MSEGPSTSVIIVATRARPLSPAVLTAALAQDVPVDIVCVADGLSQDLVARMQAHAKKESRFTVIAGQGKGWSAACNLGVERSTGECLLFLDARATLPPDAIRRFHAHAAAALPPFLIGGHLVDEKGKELEEDRRPLTTPTVALIKGLGIQEFFPKLHLKPHKDPLPSQLTAMEGVSFRCLYMKRADFEWGKRLNEDFVIAMGDMDFLVRFERDGGKAFFASDIVARLDSRPALPSTPTTERQLACDRTHFLHMNYDYAYPQFVIWALDVAIWARFAVRSLIPWSAFSARNRKKKK